MTFKFLTTLGSSGAGLLLFSLAFLGAPHDSRIADDEESSAPRGVALERVWPRLRFKRPVYLTGAGDGSGRMFVVEQDGVIRVFHPSKTVDSSSVFLDISARVSRKFNEEGLLGLAFHPEFKKNGVFYVHYSSSVTDMEGVLARYRVSRDDPDRADPDSEEIILSQTQPWRNHQGGMIEFGPDGFLYISFGDGGAANDPKKSGQDLGTWLGAILRIDVDRKDPGKAYAVPKDNPFVKKEGARPEIWAFGLRNVWRFSFDRKTGELWAGDVGQNKWEEVSIIPKGGNMGWRRFEAKATFDAKTPLATEPHVEPVAAYGRQWGISITGGYVYRGKQHRSLVGSYFYGDYASGNLWRVVSRGRGKSRSFKSELVRRTGRSIASFGEDDDGELFVLSFDGGIYRVVPSDQPENTFAKWKQTLSETGLFKSLRSLDPADHVIPYEVNAPFWSDGVDKKRWIALPKGKRLGFKASGSWDVPVGATLIKHFETPGRRRRRPIETRLIKRTSAGWESATYVWDGRGRDARLAPGGKQPEIFTRSGQVNWHAPSSSECATCHVDAAGYVLGITTEQLNRGDQLERLAQRGAVRLPKTASSSPLGRFVDPHGDVGTLEQRARVWLDVNCAMCHRPDGTGNSPIDLRYNTALARTMMIDVDPAIGTFGIDDAKLIAPGSPARSTLLHRVATLGDGRMPNIGSLQVDKEAVKLLSAWIEGMK